MNNKMNTNETLARMKTLMGYGLKTEGKNAAFSSIEYQKMGADGKQYAIIREGRNYFIKVAPNKSNLIKEDYNYIGGFRNRKDYQYDNFANAQKQFDLKMMSLKEAANKNNFNVTSWDLDKKENVVIEASDKMKKEILRERQIMKNAMAINEKNGAVCCDDVEKPKDNIKGEKIETGDAKTKGQPFEECGDKELPKEMTAEGVVKEEEVLGWNRKSPEYMDKSHGTEIGDSAPFDDATARNIDDGDKKVTKTGEMKNGVVENHGTSMHDAKSQDTPTVGVGEGPSDDNNKPFDDKKGKQIDEAIDDFGAEEEPMGDDLEGDDFGAEEEPMGDDLEGDDFGAEEEPVDDGLEGDDVYEDDLESRMSAMEDLLSQIADKLGVEEAPVDDAEYEDDDLFGDEDEDENEYELEMGDNSEMGDNFGAEEEPMDDDEMPMENRRRGGVQIYETRNFKRAMHRMMNEEGMTPFRDAGRVPQGNMNKLDDFGKHPAYQKKVMSLPPKDLQEFPDYYDMNDESVKNDSPYGEKIGDGAPFEIDPQTIDNAIAEAFNRLRNKKKI